MILNHTVFLKFCLGFKFGKFRRDFTIVLQDIMIPEGQESVKACLPILHRHRDVAHGWCNLSQSDWPTCGTVRHAHFRP